MGNGFGVFRECVGFGGYVTLIGSSKGCSKRLAAYIKSQLVYPALEGPYLSLPCRIATFLNIMAVMGGELSSDLQPVNFEVSEYDVALKAHADAKLH